MDNIHITANVRKHLFFVCNVLLIFLIFFIGFVILTYTKACNVAMRVAYKSKYRKVNDYFSLYQSTKGRVNHFLKIHRDAGMISGNSQNIRTNCIDMNVNKSSTYRPTTHTSTDFYFC